jgi:hypothetical protein
LISVAKLIRDFVLQRYEPNTAAPVACGFLVLAIFPKSRPMPLPTSAQGAVTVRQKMFWALVAALAVGQLIAFWMLCSHQVRQAQAREATLQVERVTRLAQPHDRNAVLAATENTAHAGQSAGRASAVNFSLR